MKIVRIYNCCLNLCKDRNKIAIKQNIYEDIKCLQTCVIVRFIWIVIAKFMEDYYVMLIGK